MEKRLLLLWKNVELLKGDIFMELYQKEIRKAIFMKEFLILMFMIIMNLLLKAFFPFLIIYLMY